MIATLRLRNSKQLRRGGMQTVARIDPKEGNDILASHYGTQTAMMAARNLVNALHFYFICLFFCMGDFKIKYLSM